MKRIINIFKRKNSDNGNLKTHAKTGAFINCTTTSNTKHSDKIERGAKDFARRFEGVMKELANG